jgi:type VI secretion system protein VasD
MLSITACGAAQAIHDGTVNTAMRVFTTPIPTMNLDVVNRAESGAGPTIVRVYQLTSAREFEAITDAQWLSNDLTTLHAGLLATDNIILPLGASQSLHTPMEKHTQVVGIVTWRPDGDVKPAKLLIPRKQWATNHPVTVEIGHGPQICRDAHRPCKAL